MLESDTLSRDVYLLTIDVRIFWLVAFLYAVSSLQFILHIITRINSLGRSAIAVLWIGVILHTFLIVFRIIEGARAPFQTLYESLSWFSFTVIITYLIVSRKWKDIYLPAAFVSILASAGSFYALSSRSPAVDPLSPPLQSWWFEWHVALAFFSYGVFVVSSAIEASYLIVRPFLYKNELFGLTESNIKEFRKTAYNLVLFGFPLLTFAVFSGAAWANEAWGRYWSWDPKETWSLITWTVFTMYLHSMGIPKWKGNVSSILNIIGFICMMMTFLGVNWLAKLLGIPSLHIYAV